MFYFLNPQELETRQQRAVHGLREGQLTKQHQTELGNQVLDPDPVPVHP
jgi:hypothetical protein